METVSISEARRFSLKGVQRSELIRGDEVRVELICFEAGQRDEEGRAVKEHVYQVLEGEALVRVGEESQRLGKGRLLRVPAGTDHVLENAGGGLLVVMALSRAL